MKVNRYVKTSVVASTSVLLVLGLSSSCGCRAIRGYSESRQSIAARRLSRQGLEAMHEGQWDVAEGLFAGALDITSADDRAHWGLAESLWNRGEKADALKHMEQAVRLSASEPRLMRRLARMYLDVGRYAEAEQQTLAALEADRTSAEVWALHGDCLTHRGEHAAALAAYHRALALQPEYPEVQLQIAELYRMQGRYDRLLATLDRWQDAVGPDDQVPPRVQMLRGIALRQLDRPREAQRYFAMASQSSPTELDPLVHHAEVCLLLGDLDNAKQSIVQASAISPQSQTVTVLAQQLDQAQAYVATQGTADQTMLR